jgi:Bacterial Ig-like domain (group 2)
MSNFAYTRIRPLDLLEVANDQGGSITLAAAIAAIQGSLSAANNCPKCGVTGWITVQGQKIICDICQGNLKTAQLYIPNPAVYGSFIALTIGGNPTATVSNTSQLTASVPNGTWSSSNNGVATVNTQSGVVTGIADGTATITYTFNGSSVTVSFTVTG